MLSHLCIYTSKIFYWYLIGESGNKIGKGDR